MRRVLINHVMVSKQNIMQSVVASGNVSVVPICNKELLANILG